MEKWGHNEKWDGCQEIVKDKSKRRENEKKFGTWDKQLDGSRRYFYEVQGHHGWKACYVKEVDASEKTIKFYQEIYDENGQLIEIHEKYPEDKRHTEVKGGRL